MIDAKTFLQDNLTFSRDALLWKLDGLSEYDIRRPMTPTATNLLGLVKHVASITAGYLGDSFDRPFPEPLPWLADDAPLNADMYASADEPKQMILDLYARVWSHADATIATLDLDAPGKVPWWPAPKDEVTLHQIIVHVQSDLDRHLGHADIVREMIDGAAGLGVRSSNMPSDDADWWTTYYAQVEKAARDASQA